MKKMFFILFSILFFEFLFSESFELLLKKFISANSLRNKSKMLEIINFTSNNYSDPNLIALNAEALTAIANWGINDEIEKEKYYQKAIERGKQAVIIENNAYTNYVTGAALGRIAQFKGIIESLFLLGDFDKYIKKSLEFDNKNYKALIALGMRFRDTPWPFANNSKSEELFLKAIENEPNYINSYYELGLLYKKMKKFEKAKKMFEKVIELPLHKDWIEQGKETKIFSKEELEKLKN